MLIGLIFSSQINELTNFLKENRKKLAVWLSNNNCHREAYEPAFLCLVDTIDTLK